MSNVEHPSHYKDGAYECKDMMIALFGKEAFKDFCKLNIFKYRYRAESKNGAEDKKKADEYMRMLLEVEHEKG